MESESLTDTIRSNNDDALATRIMLGSSSPNPFEVGAIPAFRPSHAEPDFVDASSAFVDEGSGVRAAAGTSAPAPAEKSIQGAALVTPDKARAGLLPSSQQEHSRLSLRSSHSNQASPSLAHVSAATCAHPSCDKKLGPRTPTTFLTCLGCEGEACPEGAAVCTKCHYNPHGKSTSPNPCLVRTALKYEATQHGGGQAPTIPSKAVFGLGMPAIFGTDDQAQLVGYVTNNLVQGARIPEFICSECWASGTRGATHIAPMEVSAQHIEWNAPGVDLPAMLESGQSDYRVTRSIPTAAIEGRALRVPATGPSTQQERWGMQLAAQPTACQDLDEGVQLVLHLLEISDKPAMLEKTIGPLLFAANPSGRLHFAAFQNLGWKDGMFPNATNLQSWSLFARALAVPVGERVNDTCTPSEVQEVQKFLQVAFLYLSSPTVTLSQLDSVTADSTSLRTQQCLTPVGWDATLRTWGTDWQSPGHLAEALRRLDASLPATERSGLASRSAPDITVLSRQPDTLSGPSIEDSLLTMGLDPQLLAQQRAIAKQTALVHKRRNESTLPASDFAPTAGGPGGGGAGGAAGQSYWGSASDNPTTMLPGGWLPAGIAQVSRFEDPVCQDPWSRDLTKTSHVLNVAPSEEVTLKRLFEMMLKTDCARALNSGGIQNNAVRLCLYASVAELKRACVADSKGEAVLSYDALSNISLQVKPATVLANKIVCLSQFTGTQLDDYFRLKKEDMKSGAPHLLPILKKLKQWIFHKSQLTLLAFGFSENLDERARAMRVFDSIAKLWALIRFTNDKVTATFADFDNWVALYAATQSDMLPGKAFRTLVKSQGFERPDPSTMTFVSPVTPFGVPVSSSASWADPVKAGEALCACWAGMNSKASCKICLAKGVHLGSFCPEPRPESIPCQLCYGLGESPHAEMECTGPTAANMPQYLRLCKVLFCKRQNQAFPPALLPHGSGGNGSC